MPAKAGQSQSLSLAAQYAPSASSHGFRKSVGQPVVTSPSPHLGSPHLSSGQPSAAPGV